MSADLKSLRQKVFDYCKLILGEGMVDVEADPIHYETMLDRSIEVFRQRSSAAVEEGFAFLQLHEDEQIYTLPANINVVAKIYRRAVGDFNTGSMIEPFSQATISTMLLNAGRTGSLTSYELFKDYQFQVDRMFGGQLDFNFNAETHKLTIFRKPAGNIEIAALQCYAYRGEDQLLTNPKTLSFIKEYTHALILESIGQAREKYSSVISPTGGTTLNGAALKTQAAELKKTLLEQITLYHFGETPLGFILG
jgi:hypothetical protein